jgi:uncharacterized protein YuzB (UPF0349 family)
MIYFLLPHHYIQNYSCIDYHNKEKGVGPFISPSLYYYLQEIKDKINKKHHEWDIVKKYTNTYEYIDTPCPIKVKPFDLKKGVSQYKPLSPSYFKMVELYSFFRLEFGPDTIQTFHLSPKTELAGSIEALVPMRSCRSCRSLKDDTYYTMGIETPSFLPFKKNVVVIETENEREKGHILSFENFVHCGKTYNSSMSLIVGDYVTEETPQCEIGRLLFAQMAYALCMQKRGGVFILTIMDCFDSYMVDLMYILSSFYEKVYMAKPDTSPSAQSEKYLVCTGFLFASSVSFYEPLVASFLKMYNEPEQNDDLRFLSRPVSYYFVTKIEEYNSSFGQSQIETLFSALSIIDNGDIKQKNNKINELVKSNVQKCIQWCSKYNISHYSLF